ncbi:hypothetical protein FHX08_006384 [Rhizobium sp. BK529]|uniref:hypothetical protein n=1 Tax=Rhizobium sp. BK529 TaxID=2586983 RepID=UPI0016229479|nr:hypothetical protein [Rhizobium sp. BK529]MBB3595964.1 hypothetical protein [Rhizobium sp. BK529]
MAPAHRPLVAVTRIEIAGDGDVIVVVMTNQHSGKRSFGGRACHCVTTFETQWR